MPLSAQQFESILKLYLFYGVDETIDTRPGNFYMPSPVMLGGMKKPVTIASAAPPVKTASGFSESPIKALKNSPTKSTAYDACDSLSALSAQFKQSIEKTRVAASARHFIHTHGVTDSPDILIILNHPTAEEEMSGHEGTGAEYDFIRFILSSCGLGGASVGYYAVCPYRPAGERSLTDEEIAQCLLPMVQSIRLIAPKTTLCLSGFINDSVTDSLALKCPDLSFFICPTPQNLRQTPFLKQKLWREIIKLKQCFNIRNVA